MDFCNKLKMEFPPLKHISECYIKPKYHVQESKPSYYLSHFDLVFLSCHYNQKGLFFAKPTHETFDIEKFLLTLHESLSHTLVHFYPLAGQFDTTVDEDQHQSLVFVDCNKGPGVRFIRAKLDINMSDITSVTHVPDVVKSFFDHQDGGKVVNYDGHTRPLLSIQVTELINGIFIGCSMCHVLVDGTSYWHFWNIWSEIHRAINKGDEHFHISRQPIHKRWIPDGYSYTDLFLPFISPNEFIFRFEPPQLQDGFFHFSSQTIAKLKSRANHEIMINNHNNNNQVSSFQALTALIWKSIIRAKGLKPNQTTQCKLAANNRTRLSPQLPEEYFGNALGLLESTTTVAELLTQNLGKTATLLHNSVANYSNKDVKDYAVSWYKSRFVYRMDKLLELESNSTVQVGSSPRFDIYGNEFSEIGKPVAVRSGFANKFDGKVIVYPGCQGGGSVDAEICLSSSCMSALQCDEEFMAAVELP